MISWQELLEVLGSEQARVIYSRVGQVVTVLSAVFAFWNSWSAKKALLAEKTQRTRKGEIELGVTYRIGGKLFRLAKLALARTNQIFTNPERENQFRLSPNEVKVSQIDGKDEQIGMHTMGAAGENKFVSLTFSSMYSEMWQLPTLWAAAGVPSRMVRFLHAIRHDTYATVDKVDGYQTARSMLFPLEEVERAGTDPSFFESETEISYQKDRLYQMREIYRIWKSAEESDKWRVVEVVMPVPELLFLGGEIAKLTDLVSKAQHAVSQLRELGGELAESRLNALAEAAATKTLAELASRIAQ